MTDDRKPGSAASSGQTSSTFNTSVTNPLSPANRLMMLGIVAGSLDKPVPAADKDRMLGVALATSAAFTLDNKNGEPVMPDWGKNPAGFSARIKTCLNPQGELDQAGLLKFIAANVSDDPRAKTVTPDPALVTRTSAMLAKLGIADDTGHSLAVTLAKGAVIGSQNARDLLEQEQRKLQPTTAPATRPSTAPAPSPNP